MFYLEYLVKRVLTTGFFLFTGFHRQVDTPRADHKEASNTVVHKEATDIHIYYTKVVTNFMHKYDISLSQAARLLEYKLLEIPLPKEEVESQADNDPKVVISNPNGNMCYSQGRMVAFTQQGEAANFIDHLQNSRKYSKNTLSLYYSYLNRFLSWRARYANKDPWWSNCSQQDIVGYLNYLKEKGNTPTTIVQKMTVLNSFFKYLCAFNKIRKNPFSKVNIINAQIT